MVFVLFCFLLNDLDLFVATIKSQPWMHFADGKDASNFCHPVGNDVNYSGGSKPGWSSHWGSVQGFNVTEEVSLSLSLPLWNKKKRQSKRRPKIFTVGKARSATRTINLNTFTGDLTAFGRSIRSD